MIRLTPAAALLAALFSLSACTLIPESEALAVYQFPQPPQATSEANAQRISLSLRIDTPQAGYAYSSPRLVVQTADNQLLGYKGVRWSDPTPTLLREYMAAAFQRHSALGTVTTDENALYADVHLSSDLRRFQIVASGEPYILIDMQARLVNPDSRRIYLSRDFTVRQPVASTAVQDVTEGYEQATAALTRQLLDWAVPQLATMSPN